MLHRRISASQAEQLAQPGADAPGLGHDPAALLQQEQVCVRTLLSVDGSPQITYGAGFRFRPVHVCMLAEWPIHARGVHLMLMPSDGLISGHPGLGGIVRMPANFHRLFIHTPPVFQRE